MGAPLFRIVPLAWDPPAAADFDALLLTSANAVEQAGPRLAAYERLPCFCVGAQTAAAARAAGLAVHHEGSGDAEDSARAIGSAGFTRALHLCGRDHRGAAAAGLTLQALAVYVAEAVAVLPETVAAALARDAIVLLHSSRAAMLFATLIDREPLDRSGIDVVAISAAVRDAAGLGWRHAVAALRPADATLLAAAATLCDGGAR